MKRIIALTVLCLLLLTSCGQKLTEGEVTAKEYTPAHTTFMMVPIVHSDGKTSYTTLVPFVYYYADKWEITIQAYDSERGETETATYRVTQAVYDAVEIGAEFVYEKTMEPDTPEYTRERQ